MLETFHNLVSICYPGGSCGAAIAYLLSLSPESWQDWDSNPDYHPPIDPQGAMHDRIPTRLGLVTDVCEWLPHDFVKVLDRNGYYYWPGVDVQPEIESYYRDTQDLVHAYSPMRRLGDVPPGYVTIHGTHASPQQIRRLYPGTRTIAVVGHRGRIMRNFYQKFLTDPIDGLCRIDHDITSMGKEASHAERKHWMRVYLSKLDIIDGIHRSDALSFVVDFDDLFSPSNSESCYRSMVRHAGMTPDWPRARDFISSYSSMQPTRPYASRGA